MLKNDSSSTWRAHPWAFAAATLLMLVILNYLHEVLSRFAAYRSLHKNHAFYVPEGTRSAVSSSVPWRCGY